MIYQITANLFIEDELLAQEIYDLLRSNASELSTRELENGYVEQSIVRLMLNKHLEEEKCITLSSFYLDETDQVIDGGA